MTKKKTSTRKKIGQSFSKFILCVSLYFVLFALLSAAITPERYDIEVGKPAPNTIKATKDIVDTVKTQDEKDEAARKVERQYTIDEEIGAQVQKEASDRFDYLSQISTLSQTVEGADDINDNQLSLVNERLAPVVLTRDELAVIFSAESGELAPFIQLAEEKLQEAYGADSSYKHGIEESQVKGLLTGIHSSVMEAGASEEVAGIIQKVAEAIVQPNRIYDEIKTRNLRQQAMDAVEPIMIIKGQVIVGDGELVKDNHYKMLSSLGIVKESSLDITLYYGVALLVLLLLLAVVLYIRLYDPEILVNMNAPVLLALISVLTVGACVLVRDISPYLMPTTVVILLVSQLVKRRLAIVMNIVVAVGVSLFASMSTGYFNMAMFTIVVNSIVGGMVGLLVLRRKQQRTTTLLAGIGIGFSNMVCTFSIGFVNNADLLNVLTMAEWSGLSGVLASILCIAVMPILEGAFNIPTPNKLLELSNPNQPLLRRLLLEAPGTYHHSIVVANLAEAAASAIGANGLLARVGAYYHDVGKLRRPSYFKENQMGDNPHDRTDPRVSTAILTAHTRDGVQLLQKERLPEAIINIVASHHGDTPVMYFYNKSRMENGDDVKIDDFRYEGPRPQSREAAIVMLADTIEAAVRSINNPDTEKLDEMIRKLIRQKMEDGQLDASDLTFGDLDRVRTSFLTVLGGVFHERIEYPSIEIPKKPVRQLTGEVAPAAHAEAENPKPDGEARADKGESNEEKA